MADHAHSSAPSNVPAELIARHQKGWKFFTQATTVTCFALAALLLAMLVGLVIL
jgi:Bacterial aa3 type cytochrome c oxidase subunit IV